MRPNTWELFHDIIYHHEYNHKIQEKGMSTLEFRFALPTNEGNLKPVDQLLKRYLKIGW
jgi:hypothetical protein